MKETSMMTTRRSTKYAADAGRRNVAKAILPAHPGTDPPSGALVDFVVHRLLTDRQAVRDPARRRLDAALRSRTVVATFRTPRLAPPHLFEAAVRDLAARGQSGWVAACAAVASLEPQALAEAIVAHAGASGADESDDTPVAESPVAESPATEAPADAGRDHLRDACHVAVGVLGANELHAMVTPATATLPARAARATVARRARPVTPRRVDAVADPIDAPAVPDVTPCDTNPEATAQTVANVTLRALPVIGDAPTDLPAIEATSGTYLEDALDLLLASRVPLRMLGITLPPSFDTSRLDVATRARAVRAFDTLVQALDGAVASPSNRHRVSRAYKALVKLVPAGRDPGAPTKRAHRSVAPPLDLTAFFADRAARVAATAQPAPADAAPATPDGAIDGSSHGAIDSAVQGALTPANVSHLPVPLTPELDVVRQLFRAGEFHGAEVTLGVVEVANRAALVSLARAMQARLNLDFAQASTLAAQASRQACDPSGAVAQEARALEAECLAGTTAVDDRLDGVDDDEWAAWDARHDAAGVRIADIYWQADRLARRDAHVEVVARINAVIDTALRWMVGREFGLDLLKAERDATALWEALAGCREVGDVAIEVAAATFPRVGEETFRYVDGLVAVVRGLAAEAALRDPVRAGRLRTVATRIEALRVVRDLRNRSFLGHRPNRVSTADMTRAATSALSVASTNRPTELLLGSLAQVLRDMGVPLATANPLLRWGERLGRLVAPGFGPRTPRVGA